MQQLLAGQSARAFLYIVQRGNVQGCTYWAETLIRSSSASRGFSAVGSNEQEQAGEASTSGRAGSYSGTEGLKERLLDASLLHVSRHGWSHSSLVAGARDLGLSPAVVGILPRAEGLLVEHFMSKCNTLLEQTLQAQQDELQRLRLSQRIAHAVKERLQMLHPVISTWPQALAVAASPKNVSHSMKLLGSLIDSIWYKVGDTSTDMSWYTKRGTLAAIYLSTELYMLNDPSPQYQDTWAALERRLHDSFVLGKALRNASGSVAEWAAQVAPQAQAMAGASAAGSAAAGGFPQETEQQR